MSPLREEIVPILKTLCNLRTKFRYRDLRNHVDSAYYYQQYPDVAAAGVDALLHYLESGWVEGRDPSAWFSTQGYLIQHPDVAKAGTNPLAHYVRHGRGEHRALPLKKFKTVEDFIPNQQVRFEPLNGIDHVNALLEHIGEANSASTPVERSGLSPLQSLFLDLVEKANLILPENEAVLHLHMSVAYPYVDQKYYLANNPDAFQEGADPVEHYCRQGWKELRNPNADFDVWWYWKTYLDLGSEQIDPLLHYALVGRDLGNGTKHNKPIVLRKSSNPVNLARKTKRLCLFALHDPQGIIDDYVVHYLTQLCQFADIFVLADHPLQPGERDKLDGIAKGIWTVQHESYDFGSYALLAEDLVGWSVIEQYDELILANDSCYLVNSLASVFSKMDAIPADWWGIQAGKGLHAERQVERNRYPAPIPIESVKQQYLNTFENHYFYNFYVASYFCVFRSELIKSDLLQDFFRTVSPQSTKLNIIRKYEIGLTRLLLQGGYNFHTFLDFLYPIHPIYSETVFDRIKEGFPFLKRLMLSENHYYVPDLGNWKERLLDASPTADVDMIEKNLLRVADSEKLYRNFRVQRDENFDPIYPELLSHAEMSEQDLLTPKHDAWWVFPACAYDHSLASNERAVFEAVRNDPRIKKIILTRSRHIALDGENVEIYPLHSVEGQQALLRSKVIFIKHTPTSNVVYPLSSDLHYFINLWHGIPLKRIGYASLDTADQRELVAREHRRCIATISSSKVDTLAMATAFYPLSYDDVWMTGLPRNDFIVRDFNQLPTDLQAEEARLRDILNGRKLVLFCPTFRSGKHGIGYELTEQEKRSLYSWLDQNNAMLGIREHMADRYQTYVGQFEGESVIDLSSGLYPNIEVLYRISSCLVTDYSSCFIDYMLTGKHEISFAHDLEDYQNQERGTFYDIEAVFPGDICTTFDEVIRALDAAAANDFRNGDPGYEWKKQLFFAFDDDGNSERVVSNVKNLLGWNC